MPKNLTDSNTWATIAVPVGTDPALASSVETPLQLLTNRTRYLYEPLIGIRAANWKEAYITAGGQLALVSDYIRGVCFDRSLDAFTVLTEDGYTIYCYRPNDGAATPAMGGGGYAWTDEGVDNPNNKGWVNSNASIASNQNGQRVVVNTNQADSVCVSSALNTWSVITTNSPGYFWYDIDHDKSGLYVIAGITGRINSSANGTTWVQRASGVTDNFVSVRHSYDPNNAYWLLLGATKAVQSADGLTWTQNSHSLGSTPYNKCLAYSKINTKWGVVLQNGDFAYSTDNGQNWTTISNPFGIGAGPYTGIDRMNLECDGNGIWIFDFEANVPATTAPTKRWISTDNAVTWHETYDGLNSTRDLTRVRFGDDLFVAVGRSEIYTSLRMVGV